MPPKKGGTPPTEPPTTPPVSTGGGGDGDEQESLLAAVKKMKELAEQMAGGRKALITHEDFSLVPVTLVGSWFLRLENGDVVWQGAVVAEPQAGVYLVHIDRQEPGVENVQRLVTLQQMATDDDGYEWRFYDSEELARNAYAASITATKKE
jgi:hypothetical protein